MQQAGFSLTQKRESPRLSQLIFFFLKARAEPERLRGSGGVCERAAMAAAGRGGPSPQRAQISTSELGRARALS